MRSGTHPPRVDRPASRAPTRSGRYSRNSDTDSGEEDGPSGVTAVLGEDRPGRLWGKASFSHTRTPCDDASTGGRRNKCAKCGDCRSLVHTVPQGARTAGDDFAGTGGLPERRRLGSSLGSPGPGSRCHAQDGEARWPGGTCPRKGCRSGPSRLVRSRLLLHGWLIKQKQYSSMPPEPSPGARKCSLSTMWLWPPTTDR